MEGPVKRAQNKAPVPLGLDRWIPQRDVRKLVWRHLTAYEREIVRCAHNRARTPQLDDMGAVGYFVRNGYGCLIERFAAHFSQKAGTLEGWNLCEVLALRGDLRAIACLYGNAIVGNVNAPSISAAAASGGHVDVLRWLHALRTPIFTHHVVSRAARHGHLNVVRWACEESCIRCTFFQWEKCKRLAQECNHLDIVAYFTNPPLSE